MHNKDCIYYSIVKLFINRALIGYKKQKGFAAFGLLYFVLNLNSVFQLNLYSKFHRESLNIFKIANLKECSYQYWVHCKEDKCILILSV